MAHWLDKIVELLEAKTDDLRELADIAGYSPATFYRGTRMDGADLSGQDLSEMEFTDLDLSKVKYDERTRLPRPSRTEVGQLEDLPELFGFFSYSRGDGVKTRYAFTQLQTRIHDELRLQSGQDIWLLRGTEASWESKIGAIARSSFFIPIISPSALVSDSFRNELEEFLHREAELGRRDLIFPIVVVSMFSGESQQNEIWNIVRSLQYVDWKTLDIGDTDSPAMKKAITHFCRRIVRALRAVPLEPPEIPHDEDTADRERRADAPKRVYISYRYDTEYQSMILGRLQRTVPPVHLFISDFVDNDAIPLGTDFVEYIERRIADCDVMLVLIDPGWTDAVGTDGRRRLEKPDDFVRIEIRAALGRGIPVVPVLLDGAPMPDVDSLPEDLRDLAWRQAVSVQFSSFEDDMTGVMSRLGVAPADPTLSKS